MAFFAGSDRAWAAVLDAAPGPVHRITYEELTGDSAAFHRLATALGLDAEVDAIPSTRRQDSPGKRALLARFRADQRRPDVIGDGVPLPG